MQAVNRGVVDIGSTIIDGHHISAVSKLTSTW